MDEIFRIIPLKLDAQLRRRLIQGKLTNTLHRLLKTKEHSKDLTLLANNARFVFLFFGVLLQIKIKSITQSKTMFEKE